MNPIYFLLLFPNSSDKPKNQGFTLIELLVVVIIIGILAAIAIPNLMSQIGKAREGEAKSIIGALNRAQQAYFFENGVFSSSDDPGVNLEIPMGTQKYYDVVKIVPDVGVHYMHNNENDKNNTRDYVGAVQYNEDTRGFGNIVCRMNKDVEVNSDTDATNQLNGQYGVRSGSRVTPLACEATAKELK
jgi:type IV pilus assembly protein PilA